MAKLIDLTGRKFGKLKVLSRAGTKICEATWFCECECGERTIVTSSDLRKGKVKSCGCDIPEMPTIEQIPRRKRTVGKRIELVRKRKKVSLTNLSAKTKIKEEDLIDYECDVKSPTLLTAIRIATALDTSITEFSSWDNHAEL